MKNIRFVRYHDLILFEEKSFLSKFKFDSREEFLLKRIIDQKDPFFEELRKKLRFKRAGFITNICDDNFRTPNVYLFYCDSEDPSRPIDPWVIHSDNGIKYTFDVTRTMFSKGNINEKLRLAQIDCHNENVVDLFAGIGYFSLIFAVHCRAKHVYCCEWNPVALEALQRNIHLNKVESRMSICPGDNRLACPRGLAQRVQMGLIPTSLGSLDVACRSLDVNSQQSNQLTLHVHENLNYYSQIKSMNKHEAKQKLICKVRQQWAMNVAEQVLKTLQKLYLSEQDNDVYRNRFEVNVGEITRVKQYASYIDHMVVDILCSVKRFTTDQK